MASKSEIQEKAETQSTSKPSARRTSAINLQSKEKGNSRHVKDVARCMLWGRAAGRCQKCNVALSWDPHTKADANLAEAAHIIGFSKAGPRPERDIPEELINDIDNLMLLCRLCHTPVVDAREKEYTVDRLRAMKRVHEDRVNKVTGIGRERGSHILLYGANIGNHSPLVSQRVAATALIATDRFPADRSAIELGMVNSALHDRTKDFWRIEAFQLRAMIDRLVMPRLRNGEVQHLSIFAAAPQPLLVLLGHLLCDVNYEVEVYQLHREPPGWEWQEHPKGFEYVIERPQVIRGVPCLVLGLSAHVNNERVHAAIGSNVDIWRVTIPQPHNDYLKSATQLRQFRELIRPLLDEIKDLYHAGTALNIFPAAPVAACTELGRVIQPKAHMSLRLWDQNKDLGGFIHALDINLAQESLI